MYDGLHAHDLAEITNTVMTLIRHIDPDAFLIDTVRLGQLVYRSGFRPKHAISIWRGGTPVGLGVDAFFRANGIFIDHTTIATGSYTGIGKQGEVIVKNLEHLVNVVCREDPLLIIDDVYESGRTIATVVDLLRKRARANAPDDIRVATVHHKPDRSGDVTLPLYALEQVDGDLWVDYPHELADLVRDDDPDDKLIRDKDEALWRLLRSAPAQPGELPALEGNDEFIYLSPRDLLLDSIRLGVQISNDDWHPDFMIALWPGGVIAGLPVHEVYKYFLRKNGQNRRAPDHISINTSSTRSSMHSAIVGLNYLEERINEHDRVLIIDTTFRAGRLVNNVITRLKEVLRRNLDHRNVRVASVYYNPEDRSTWTVRPDIRCPHYYVRRVHQEVVYPANIHKLPNAKTALRTLNPKLADIFFE